MRKQYEEIINLEAKMREEKDEYKDPYYKDKSSNTQSKIIFPEYHLTNKNKQLLTIKGWFYNGFLIYLPEFVMLVDPGIEITYRLDISGIKINSINTMFVSHGHLDHVAGANVVMDWLISNDSPTQIITTKQVIEDGEISPYHAGLLNDKLGWEPQHFTTYLDNQKSIKTKNGNYELTPIEMDHGIDCYGFKLKTDKTSISYLSDTGYSKQIESKNTTLNVGDNDNYGVIPDKILKKNDFIKDSVKGSDYLIINMETFSYRKKTKTHLNYFDVIDIATNNDIKNLIVSHINPSGTTNSLWRKEMEKNLNRDLDCNIYLPEESGLEIEVK